MPSPVDVLHEEAETCVRCHAEGLLHSCGDDRAYPVFQKPAPWPVRVLAIAEAPNESDSFDPAKRRLTIDADTDPSGAFLFALLASVGLSPDDVLFTNSVLCLPARNDEGKHPVSARQQDLCSTWLERLIEAANPAVIVTFGGTALQAVGRVERHGLTLRHGAGKLHAWRGRHLLPLYHPGRLGRVSRPRELQLQDVAALRPLLGSELTPDIARDVMEAHRDGARLVLRGADGGVFGDVACCIGFQWGRVPAFAYLSAHAGPPFATDTKFYVERAARHGDGWSLTCRSERGIRQIELHRLADEEQAALRASLEALAPEVVEHMEETMRAMLDPRAL